MNYLLTKRAKTSVTIGAFPTIDINLNPIPTIDINDNRNKIIFHGQNMRSSSVTKSVNFKVEKRSSYGTKRWGLLIRKKKCSRGRTKKRAGEEQDGENRVLLASAPSFLCSLARRTSPALDYLTAWNRLEKHLPGLCVFTF